MKKVVVIVICLVSSLLLTGVAYASWSIGADVTVNAGTAELEAEIVKASVKYTSKGVTFTGDSITIKESGKAATVNIDNIYPGAKAQFELEIENTGTMGISFDEIIQKFDEVIDTSTGQNLGLDSTILKSIVVSYDAETRDEHHRQLKKLTHESATGEQSMREIFADASPMEIEPGETLNLVIEIKMDENAGNETMNKQFCLTISPLFIQN